MALNETHDPRLQSWVESANSGRSDFPIQNLPWCIFRRRDRAEAHRAGVAIGDQVLDVAAALGAATLEGAPRESACLTRASVLNEFMAAGAQAWSATRLALSRALRRGAPQRRRLEQYLVPQSAVEYAVPAQIGDYTDFYASIYHATAVGRLLRPDNPLLPNYKWVPIAYHGRCSSIGVSGQEFPRPRGQILAPGAAAPVLSASRRLDYELELGIFIGQGQPPGLPIAIDAAESFVFGLCLLNDWSARDVQAWEYQPLGPFLAKNFATTISPWIVTLEALEPYREPWNRPAEDPQPLSYLDSPNVRSAGAIDIHLEVALESEVMRRSSSPPHTLARTNFRHSYWSVAQLLTHHAVNGCSLRPGDLIGTGTQSGPDPSEAGSLLELTRGGKEPIVLNDGETRRFLEDGDTVIMSAYCVRPGAARIGFGSVSGRVLPALPVSAA